MKTYSINAIENFINKYCVDCLLNTDSVVGLGHQIWTMNNGRFFEVKEHFQNCWSSTHTIRQFSKISKAQQKLIDNQEYNVLLQD